MLGINAIKITPEILLKISEIDEFKGLWSGLDRHTTGLQVLSDVFEYGQHLDKLLSALDKQKLNPDVICILHANIIGMKGKTAFKAAPNQLPFSSGDRVFGTLDTAEPDQVEPLLSKLCSWLNEELDKKQIHPLIIAAVFASVFLQVFPYSVGNMRLVRFLMMLIMLKSGYAYAPYVSFTKIMDTHAEDLYTALRDNQASLEEGVPVWHEWISVFLDLLVDQKNVLHDRLYAKETELKDLPKLSAKIMTLFRTHQRLQMKEIIKLTNGRRATIKLRLQELVDDGYLKRRGAGRGTWYALT